VALLTFPPSPLNGDLFPISPLPGQSQYEWSSADSTWRLLGAATGVIVGTYGDASNVGQFTVDAQGRLTSAANVPITFPTTLTFVTAPTASADLGTSGEVAVDGTYLYVYAGTQWQRVAWDTAPW
jgi:hypothetical protein